MASMQIEVAASSSPFVYSLKDHNRSANVKGYIHSQCIRMNKTDGDQDEDSSSWLPTKSDVDDSWLPANSAVTSESEGINHRKGKNNDVDDSWLPTVNDTSSGKCGANTNEPENDFDYSWLPSTFIDNNKNKHKNDIITSRTKNNKNTNTNKNIKNHHKKSTNNYNNSNSNSLNNSNNNLSPQKRLRNDHWALAREVVFSCDHQIQNPETLKKPSDSSRFQQQDTPSEARYVVESPTSGGVSSLLQRWKDLAETKSSKNKNSSPSSKRNNSGSTCKENKNDNSSHSPKDSDANWESDKASRSRRLSCPLPSRDSKDSNLGGTEKEKIRVVDIIKKLSREEELAASHAGGHGNGSLPPIRTTSHHKQIEGENKGIKGVKVSRHLIRGRQAFNNFLMQMEHDKHHELKRLVERKAVSKFSHRGRIQALLRFKILRLGAESKPEAKSHRRCVSKTLESNTRLDIMDLRERFNSGAEKGATQSRKHKRNDIKNTLNEETPATPCIATREADVKTKTKTTISNKKKEPEPTPEPMTPNQSTQYPTTPRKQVVHKAKFVDSSSNVITPKEDRRYKDYNKYEFHEDEGQFMSAKTSYSQIEDRGISDSEETNYSNRKQALENFDDWMTSEYSQTRSDLDEEESYDDMQLFDTSYDWISDVSRPKSDWEYMRQARYQEMSTGNVDIQRLLERKSVSSFLGSSLRDVIDQLMVSRSQQSNVHVEKQDVVVSENHRSRKEEVEHEDGSMVDDDGDCRSRTETKCSEYSEYVDQTPYSERSWRPNDTVYNSETATTTSPSLERSLSSNRSHNNSTPQSSSGTTHQTIEMELIYDLRGHMEQLHQEIMELRKSIKSCVSMQVKMQHSLKQNIVSNATSHSVQKKERKLPGIVKRDCSICSDMQVDSFLYRCGHMCACFNCALELQRSSGVCPVCEAPIVDVVKAVAHEN